MRKNLENKCLFALPTKGRWGERRGYLCLKSSTYLCDDPDYLICPKNPDNIPIGEVYNKTEKKGKIVPY